mmetsp:Transcript_16570/g.35867  ORF Transcript_16570/g.35867 Transcript_16570/m.35867 type:complete len:202 (-) Transcript_16570:1201-1806(-)
MPPSMRAGKKDSMVLPCFGLMLGEPSMSLTSDRSDCTPKQERIMRVLLSPDRRRDKLETMRLATLSPILKEAILFSSQSKRRFLGLYAMTESRTSELRSWTTKRACPDVRLWTTSARPLTRRRESRTSVAIMSAMSSLERLDNSISVTSMVGLLRNTASWSVNGCELTISSSRYMPTTRRRDDRRRRRRNDDGGGGGRCRI